MAVNSTAISDALSFIVDGNAISNSILIVVYNTLHILADHFRAASDWIADNQDDKGGWPVSVTRKITSKQLTLKPGWYVVCEVLSSPGFYLVAIDLWSEPTRLFDDVVNRSFSFAFD